MLFNNLDSLQLRPMQPDDLNAVLDVENSIHPFPWSRRNFEDSLNGGYSCWIGTIDYQIVGYFILMISFDEAHLLTIGVAKRYQHQGIGARLLSHAFEVARFAHMKTLLLEVRRSNAKALRLYEQFGFREIGVRKAYYPAGNEREDALVLNRSIEEVFA